MRSEVIQVKSEGIQVESEGIQVESEGIQVGSEFSCAQKRGRTYPWDFQKTTIPGCEMIKVSSGSVIGPQR